MSRELILFQVRRSSHNFFCYVTDREAAKRQARSWLGGDPDTYTVTPLTNVGETIYVGMALYV